MSVVNLDERIITALSPIVSEIEPILYEGDSLEYIVFNYNEVFSYAESTADARRCIVQVHYYLPFNVNPNANKRLIANALHDAGFTYPSIYNASDSNGQHYTFQCEYVDGIV